MRTSTVWHSNARWRNGAYAVVVTNIAKTGGNLSTSALLTFVTDTDGDGLPDDWETAHGLNPANPADASFDSDGDGMTNWQEYIAGTDPSDPQSYLKVDAASGTPTTLRFNAVSNRTYTVLYTDSLESSSWSSLAEISARATNRAEIILDPAPRAGRFYRLVTPRQSP